MISRKDNLLIRPWQQRNFYYHRQKVLSALPAIDNGSPPHRGHVVVKLKKEQKEKEKCRRIERDNYLLLQKLRNIMKTNRVDNSWKIPQPNFLNRVALYGEAIPEIEDLLELDFVDQEEPSKSRKQTCLACTRKKVETVKISEERIPWEPMKQIVCKTRSKSVPVGKYAGSPSNNKETPSLMLPSSGKSSVRTNKSFSKNTRTYEKDMQVKQSQGIILSRGSLKLSMNFPSDTTIKFHDGSLEKTLKRGLCFCRSNPPYIL